ncbi:glutamine-hydrolyzing GMP synthase [Culicoidibacter larvae]|uniref:GMP synthase [glutamine-hydrolyzing] n=1 Tax=Culicoidibacter larvae TaxID=2579976 RepID=A0A5R8Q7Q4_9FIRM|nr:glutamine-hydrolyzing GMP synthase [Culicoidibacter larvae]TLG71514.1 glutamine-hydrolyzing GMP synthase [Culicoidibacter larvae]
MKHDSILVLDFGSQYNQLIARRIRDFGVYSELLPPTTTAREILDRGNVRGIIFSGGPDVITDKDALMCDPAIFELGIPILGICYGLQLMAHHFGGEVERAVNREYGMARIRVIHESPLFKGLAHEQTVWMSHGYHATKAPEGFTIDAVSESCPIVAMSDERRNFYGLQFHPEVRHSEHGIAILGKFVFDICGAVADWSMKNFIDEQVANIRAEVGSDKVLCALSGGVDSSVVATLLHRAIGDQLVCMFVDHGLLRKNEGDMVMDMLENEFNMHILRIDARERFLNKLAGVSEPEAKRKIIGEEFIRVFEDESKKLTDVKFLAQGTLYTDIIESGTATAQTIKSHHNVGGLPEDMQFALIEPVKTLFKDEVRALGIELGIAEDMVWRQPFPGPGLGIRVIGDVTEEKLHIVRESDWILREEVAKAGLEREIWQYFTVLTNLKSVGVMGDERTYDYTVGIRAVTSIDGMTADFARVPWDVLQAVSVRIVNEVKHVNRVVYDITSKPPATIEWE